MIKIESCCCCVAIDAGVMIIGALCFLQLTDFIYNFEIYGFLIALIVCASFILMMIRNNSLTRLIFLVVYIVEYIAVLTLRFAILSPDEGGFDADAHA